MKSVGGPHAAHEPLVGQYWIRKGMMLSCGEGRGRGGRPRRRWRRYMK